MSTTPLVTVITPSYNQGRFIEQTIHSVLSQDYPNVEYLVVDGGSTDQTIDILRKYEGSLSWVSEKDNGQTDAINKGIRKARGEIVCWLNSDDTYEPGAIWKAVEVFNANPDAMLVYGEGNEIAEDGAFLHRFPATQQFDLWALTYIHDYILQPTTFFKKTIFQEIDYPCEKLNWCMDWDLWIRIGRRYQVVYCEQVLANSRIYKDTKTGSGGLRRLKEINSVMRKYGNKKFPLGCFLYGVDTYETICRDGFPFVYKFVSPAFTFARSVLGKAQYRYQGVFTDRWLGKTANFMIPATGDGCRRISFNLEAPAAISPSNVEIYVDSQWKGSHRIASQGLFLIDLDETVSQGQTIEVQLVFERTFKPENDPRALSCRLHNLEGIFP